MLSSCKTSFNVSKIALPVKRTITSLHTKRPAIVRAESKSKDANIKFEQSLPVGISCSLAIAMMSTPLAAEAAVTPSLQNLLYSVIAGAVVFGAIAGGVTFVSTFDPLNRRN